ncbi:MAG: serine protease [Candidatus Moranbacteria bacterium]|nr:serine protease [Candidatus Moranbacteria bacterium]MDD3964681.1 serine protease [Candidatus Moranbacteria bacterium]
MPVPASLLFHSFLLSGFLLFTFFSLPQSMEAKELLPEEALVDLVKPSIVRIVSHTTGSAQIPFIKVDIVKNTVAIIPDKYSKVTIDEYLVGSGFIIHPDGYIATNAHVVSEETLKQILASERAMSVLYENALFLSDADMETFLNSESENNFSQKVLQFVIDNSQFDLTVERVVLRPDSSEKSLTALFSQGFPASIVSVNDNFVNDEQDVALIKINESRLPALSLGESASLAVGKKAFILGFPATAELNQNSALEATFTQGVVSALKQSGDKSFRLFQTDAKVSEGSSGGPLFDEEGLVTGIVTLQTDALDREQGDNFAFALPIEMMKNLVVQTGITPVQGAYSKYFREGFRAFSLRQCDKAMTSLNQSLEGSNPLFVQKKSFERYANQCREWKKGGTSVDTGLDVFQEKIRALGDSVLYLIGIGLLLFGIFGSILFWVLRQVVREEKEIASLETRLHTDESLIKKYEQSLAQDPRKKI